MDGIIQNVKQLIQSRIEKVEADILKIKKARKAQSFSKSDKANVASSRILCEGLSTELDIILLSLAVSDTSKFQISKDLTEPDTEEPSSLRASSKKSLFFNKSMESSSIKADETKKAIEDAVKCIPGLEKFLGVSENVELSTLSEEIIQKQENAYMSLSNCDDDIEGQFCSTCVCA
jgi:hypothetical protein